MPGQIDDDPPRGRPPMAGPDRARHPTPGEVAACYGRLAAIRDPLDRRFALLREAEGFEVEVGELEALLADFALGRRTRRGTLESWLYRLARRLEERSFFEILEYVGRLAIVFAIASFFIGLPERRAQHRASRWEMVQAAAGGSYDGDRVGSLEILNRQCFPLQGVAAPGAQLSGLALDRCHQLPGGLTVGGAWLGPVLPFLYAYRGANLKGADLTAANLEGARLRGADLSNAHLARADLSGADLSGADLVGADLTGAVLVRADLTGANLFGADLTGANLFQADLTGATLHLARLCGTSFVASRLRRAELDHAEGCPAAAETGPAPGGSPAGASPDVSSSAGSSTATTDPAVTDPAVTDPAATDPAGTVPFANFSGADLTGAHLFAADLRGGRFHRVRVDRQTAFDGADLAGARFDHTTVPGAELFAAAAVPPASPGDVAPAAGDRGSATPPLRLALVQPDQQHFFTEVRQGMVRAALEVDPRIGVTAHELGVDLGGPHPPLLTEIDDRADAVVLRMPGLELREVLALRDAGVALACYDQCPEGAWGAEVFVVSTESTGENLGTASGEVLRQWQAQRRRSLPPDVPLLVLRSCLGEGCFRRVRGLRDELRGPGSVTSRHAGSLREAAYRVAVGEDLYPAACDLLRRQPGPAVLWATNEQGTEAAVEAVHALGRQGEVSVFGIDWSPALAAMLVEPQGALQAVVAQDPGEMGYVAASRALAAARNEPVPYERLITGHRTWARQGMSAEQRSAIRELAGQADPESFPRAPARACPPG